MGDEKFNEPLLLPAPSEGTADSRPSHCHNDDQPSKNQSVSSGFDYEVVPADIAHVMRAAANRIREHHRMAVIEVGHELLAVKAQAEHGDFIEWIGRECEMSIRAAQRAMLAAETAAKNDKLSYLPPDGLLALAAPSAPKPVVADIFARINAGERPTAADIKLQLKAAKPPSPKPDKRARQEPAEDRKNEQFEREQADRVEKAKAAVAILIPCLGVQLKEVVELLEGADMLRVRSELCEAHAASRTSSAGISAFIRPRPVYQGGGRSPGKRVRQCGRKRGGRGNGRVIRRVCGGRMTNIVWARSP